MKCHTVYLSPKEQRMDIVMVIGRILFAYIFVNAGYNHFVQAKVYVELAETQKVKFPRALTYLSGLVLLLGGLSIILGVYADVGALVLVAVLLIMAVKMHNYWSKTDEHAEGAFWKNVSMAGAALFFFALVANGGEFGPVVNDGLLSLFSSK